MKHKENWLEEIKLDEVSVGLDKVKHYLQDKVVCLHSNMIYGIPDSVTLYMIKNFKDLGLKKLIITSFPISDEPEEWTDLLEGEKYVIEKVPSKLAEDDDFYSINVEGFLAKHKEEFKVRDNSEQVAHISIIKAADVVIGFPSVNLLEPYVRMIDRYNKNFIIGGYVNEENFIDYLKAFEMRKFELTSSDKVHIDMGFYHYDGLLIWMDNFGKNTPHDSEDSNYYCGCTRF